MKNVNLDHINLSVNNLEETVQWYKDIFGFELAEQGKKWGRRWGILRNGNSMIAFMEYPQRNSVDSRPEGFHNINHFGLRIDDENQWRKVAEEQDS